MWNLYGTTTDIVHNLVLPSFFFGVSDAIRQRIFHLIGQAYTSIEAEQFASYAGLQVDEAIQGKILCNLFWWILRKYVVFINYFDFTLFLRLRLGKNLCLLHIAFMQRHKISAGFENWRTKP